MEAADLVALEKTFWTGGVDVSEPRLAREVMMVFQHGPMSRREILESLRAAPRWTEVDITQATVRQPAPGLLALGYRARARRNPADPPYEAWVGSVYVVEAGEWHLAFHQHSPIITPSGNFSPQLDASESVLKTPG